MAKAFIHLPFKLDKTQKKIIISILAITLPLFLFFLSFIQETASKELKEFSKQKASHITLKITSEIEHYLQHASVFTKEASYMLRLHPTDYTALLPFLKKQLQSNPNIYGTALAIEPSSVLHTHYCKYLYKQHHTLKEKWLMPPAYDYLNKAWYKKVKEHPQKGRWSKPYFDKGGGEVFMSTFSYPLHNSQGAFLGVVTADINIETLSQKIQKMTFSKEGFVFILDKNGLLLSHPNHTYHLRQSAFTYAKEIHSPSLLKALHHLLSTDYGSYSVKLHNETYTLYSRTLPNSDLKIAIFFNNTQLYYPLTILKQKLTLLALLGIGLILLMLILILREFKEDIIKKTKLKNELDVAKKIQLSFLPKAKQYSTDNYEIESYFKAAQKVGGDLYGYKEREDSLLFYIGDVSGKGIPAALFMMATQIILEDAIDTQSSPAEILSFANTKLLEITQSSMFVTLLVIEYHFKTHTLTLSNAGHPIPIILQNKRLFSPLTSLHPPINTFETIIYQNHSLHIKAPFQLLCFSDGITEAENIHQTLFGIENVTKSLSETFSITHLLKQIDRFVQNNPQNDDRTLLLFSSKRF